VEFEDLVDRRLDQMPRDAAWLVCVVLLAAVCRELEDGTRASVLYELLLPYDGRAMVPDRAWACRGAVSHYLGQLAALAGRYEPATGHFEDALVLNRRLGARPLLARTRYDYAGALLARGQAGDAAAAQGFAAQAVDTAQALGLTTFATRARVLLDRAAGR
jgi:ATP/maltotriose-dependent transcriptional regulator MalT